MDERGSGHCTVVFVGGADAKLVGGELGQAHCNVVFVGGADAKLVGGVLGQAHIWDPDTALIQTLN